MINVAEERMSSRAKGRGDAGSGGEEIDLVVSEIVSVSDQRMRQSGKRPQIIHRPRALRNGAFSPQVEAGQHFEKLAGSRFEQFEFGLCFRQVNAKRHVFGVCEINQFVEQVGADAVRSVRTDGRNQTALPCPVGCSAISDVLLCELKLWGHLVWQKPDQLAEGDDQRAVIGNAIRRPVAGDDVADHARA